MKQRNGFMVMGKLIGLVRPLTGYMILAIAMGLMGHLCAAFITVSGGYAVLNVLGFETPLGLGALFAGIVVMAVLRAGLRYGEQACNHFIAFKLLALIRDKVFQALRRLCPAKLEGRDKGDLISVITSDIELLEVFYAHTISPAAIAALFSLVLVNRFLQGGADQLVVVRIIIDVADGVVAVLVRPHIGAHALQQGLVLGLRQKVFLFKALEGALNLQLFGHGESSSCFLGLSCSRYLKRT